MSDEQFVLLATVPIKAGCEDEYLALVNGVNDEMRREPNFMNTVLHRSAEDAACSCCIRHGGTGRTSSPSR